MADHRPCLVVDSGSARFAEQVKSLPDAKHFDVAIYPGQGEAALADLMPDAEIVYIYQHGLTAEMIASAPKLRFIQKHGLNTKNIDVAAASARGIKVATLPLLRNVTVAEHAFALMLACAHKIVAGHLAVANAVYADMGIVPIRTAQREIKSNWARIEGLAELMDASIGIIGLGDIGMEIAKRASAFGMKVLYSQRQRHQGDIEARFQATFLPFDELLASVDHLVLVLPHTAETEGMIGARQLALMKRSATLINVARGGIVDEDALVAALQSGEIAMAGLDVFRDEPLPATSPLRALPNVVLAPHTGGGSYRSREVDQPAGLANILRFVTGAGARGIVNP